MLARRPHAKGGRHGCLGRRWYRDVAHRASGASEAPAPARLVPGRAGRPRHGRDAEAHADGEGTPDANRGSGRPFPRPGLAHWNRSDLARRHVARWCRRAGSPGTLVEGSSRRSRPVMGSSPPGRCPAWTWHMRSGGLCRRCAGPFGRPSARLGTERWRIKAPRPARRLARPGREVAMEPATASRARRPQEGPGAVGGRRPIGVRPRRDASSPAGSAG
jgi:hypothetical protein